MEKDLPVFDPRAWNYDHQSTGHGHQLRNAILNNQQLVANLHHKPGCAGGKALGLLVGEQVARYANDTIPGVLIEVPAWESFSNTAEALVCPEQPTTTTLNRFIEFVRRKNRTAVLPRAAHWKTAFIIRESPVDSDWNDGSYGDHMHFIQAGDYPLANILTSDVFTKKDTPFIVQKYHRGVGILVDIAWSSVLSRVVGRIVWGRRLGQQHTSATWDHEGAHGLFCPITGDTLLPFSGHSAHQSITTHSKELIQSLYHGLVAVGCQFGARFELVQDEHEPHRFYLVQFRPTPDELRCTDTLDTHEPVGKKCILTTTSVHGVFREEKKVILASQPGTTCPNGNDAIMVWETPLTKNFCCTSHEFQHMGNHIVPCLHEIRGKMPAPRTRAQHPPLPHNTLSTDLSASDHHQWITYHLKPGMLATIMSDGLVGRFYI